jgi:Phytanoyl-CoA dioxygenase (PhyH)
MKIDNWDALSELGVKETTLSNTEKTFLDTNGYLNLGQLLSPAQLDAIRSRLSALLSEEGDQAGAELIDSPYIRHPREEGADRLADLVNKGPEFDVFYTHPRVLAGIAHVIGREIKLSSLNYRAARPGMGQQKLHVDWHEPVLPGEYKVCNSIWLLDDFAKENGATRIVPGTHRSGSMPQEELSDPWARHFGEVLIEASAGTVFIFNSHAWHGGTKNTTAAQRRAIHSYFCRIDQPQQVDQKKYIRSQTLQRLSPAAIRLLGVK